MPGGDRDPLLDRQPLRRRRPSRSPRGRAASARPARFGPSTPGQTTSSALAAGLERQLVGERERLHDGDERVQPVLARLPTKRQRLTLPGARARRTLTARHRLVRAPRHSSGAELLGARVGGAADRLERGARARGLAVHPGQRERARQRLAAVREARADERAQLRLGRRAARRRPTSTESTFGTGWKTLRDTGRSTRTSHASWASTDGAP